ncbi:tRNA pseudouridine(55) synthase TruB [Paucilactobacillus sp. N302-9]
MDGIIPLYKERGLTSHDCVNQLRKILHTKKIGHSGTLDPNVDGVLPICIGKATKVVDYLMDSGKQYKGQLLIGQATTTEDLDGEIIAETKLKQAISADEITAAMQTLTGSVIQIPPMYSAVKVNGRKLYEYARAHEQVERPKRTIEVHEFKLLETNYDGKSGTQTVDFIVTCGKGTYIRTLVVDLANKLGYPGVMSNLTRQKSGGFSIEQTYSMDQIETAVADQRIEAFLLPLDYALKKFDHITLSTDQWAGVQNGVWLKTSEVNSTADVVALVFDQETKALYQKNEEQDCYKPLKMFSNH